MIIHKLRATCDCEDKKCPAGKDGAVVNINLTAEDERDVEFIMNLLSKIETCASRVEQTMINGDEIPIMQSTIFSAYRIPQIARQLSQLIGLLKKEEEENPFDTLEDFDKPDDTELMVEH